MDNDNPFPRTDALWPSASGSPLHGLRIEHEYYGAVKDWAWDRIECNDEPVVLVILGGTGAGKTTLREQIQEEISARLASEIAASRSTIPYVFGETVFNPRVGVDWTGLFKAWLSSGGEVLIDRKITPEGSERPGTLPTLHRAVMQMMRYRKPAIAMVDEASVLLGKQSTKASATLETNVNYLKGICNISQTHLGLFGDYKLSELMHVSGQLNRRIHFAHLPPYPDLCDDFRNVIREFERCFAKAGYEAALSGHADLLFQGCCGCVGLLRRWLMEAHIRTRRGRTPITKNVLVDTAFPAAILSIWRSEFIEGATRVAWMRSAEPIQVFDPRE